MCNQHQITLSESVKERGKREKKCNEVEYITAHIKTQQ